MPRPALRFSISHRGRFAAPWTAKSWGTTNRFVVARDGAGGLHFTRHQDGFVSLCAIGGDGERHYLPDTASRTVRQGTILVATILRPPIVCEETAARPGVVYEPSPDPLLWIAHRVYYEPRLDPANLPGERLPATNRTGVLEFIDGAAVVVMSERCVMPPRQMKLSGKIFTPAEHTTDVGGFAYIASTGLVFQEGLNASGARPAED